MGREITITCTESRFIISYRLATIAHHPTRASVPDYIISKLYTFQGNVTRRSENMIHYMANNLVSGTYGTSRTTSRSFPNLTVPLSGTWRLVTTSVLIFTFVALWPDLNPGLLAWGRLTWRSRQGRAIAGALCACTLPSGRFALLV